MSVSADPKHVPTETVSCETTSQLSESACGFQSHSGSRRRHTSLSPDACILTRTSLGPPSLKTHISAPRCPFWLIQSMYHIKRCTTRLYLDFQSLSTCLFCTVAHIAATLYCHHIHEDLPGTSFSIIYCYLIPMQ